MKDFQDYNKEKDIIYSEVPKKTKKGVSLSPIKTLDQIIASYFVMRAITEIRGENTETLLEEAKKMLPTLNVKNERSKKLYLDFAEVVNYTPVPILLAKIGLETMEEMSFKDDPSVISAAKQDVAHLVASFGNNYSTLSEINLFDHSLNVFEEGINKARGFGRVMQVAIPTIACLYHDFGKSIKLRTILIGDSSGRGYRPHAEVSELFISSMLADQMKKSSPETKIPAETLKLLATIVKYHHPGQKGKVDSGVLFVIESDMAARNKEAEKQRSLVS